MARKPDGPLRTGFTTGACATAAASAACGALLTGDWADPVHIFLPNGDRVPFALEEQTLRSDEAIAAVRKDAGDDPDVTHGALIRCTVRHGPPGVAFRAGDGVGTVTKPGLPIPPGQPAINPVPRRMITDALTLIAEARGAPVAFEVEVSIPGGAEIARQTWNGRLGIEGGLSILGTTGIVRPFSCAAWIASIHRGIDVARANGLTHAVGSTGATSERVAQQRYGLPDWAMLDMGDFAGGMLKYLRSHPIERITIAGGFAKLVKLSQGALDLHSGRSQVDFEDLAARAADLGADPAEIAACNTAKQALDIVGPDLAAETARRARAVALDTVRDADIALDILVVDRQGRAVAEADARGARVL
ncbi:MAG: cobalt-precorrin-5B (C(1))-methyltransferase [Pseudomonadota bacterium]